MMLSSDKNLYLKTARAFGDYHFESSGMTYLPDVFRVDNDKGIVELVAHIENYEPNMKKL